MRKIRKLNTGKYFPAEHLEATSKNVVGNNYEVASEQRPRMEPQVLAVEASTPAAKEMPLVLVVKP